MVKLDVILPIGYTSSDVADAVCAQLPLERSEIRETLIVKRSLCIGADKIEYKTTVAISASPERETGLLKMRKRVSEYIHPTLEMPDAHLCARPVVVGAGPAGLFCALILAECGARPIVYERGMDVDSRQRRVDTFKRLGILDTECNVQYGEGGAGTYSDGKLKVGAMDKYKMKVLSTFVHFGADEEILYSVGAHVGTDMLSGIVKKIRERIITLGGEVHFCTRLVKINIHDGKITGGEVEREGKREEFETDTLVMATGHSARDSFELLYDVGAPLERRGFGIGLRIEHPREYIDKLVYGNNDTTGLGAASYHLVTHLAGGRSVYSFCMCPGGVVVPAASEECGIVTNGMSEHARDGENSNAALLVSVTPEDFGSDSVFAGLDLQRSIEKRAFTLAGGDYKAPASSLSSFMNGERAQIGDVKPSYAVGTVAHSPCEYLPSFITDSLKAGICDFDKWMHGFALSGAALTGPETRSTSPIRVTRDERTKQTLGIKGLYCAGEGAGYSGGIVSSARDGIIIAEAIIKG